MKIQNEKKRKGFGKNFGIGKDKDYFVENLSTLVSSGMTVLGAVASLKEDVKSKRMKTILGEMEENINSGYSLWRALDYSDIFPQHVISLVRIGEESGKLSENLKVVGSQRKKDREFKSKVRSAVMYPLFVLVIAFVIALGIAWFILPKLSEVFAGLKLELPFITEALINMGQYMAENGIWVLPGILLFIALVVYFIFFFPKTRNFGRKLIFHAPGIKRLVKEIEVYRLGYLLGTLLDTGLPVTEALDSLARVTSSPYYKSFYEYLAKSIEEGKSFQKSFAEYPKLKRLFPSSIIQLVVVGEQSGTLSKTLLSIGETYENKIEITTKNLSVILEPVLLVIVWVGVMAVAFAVILPIYSLIGGIQTSP
jgi:type IV pilus assembly protein PilC